MARPKSSIIGFIDTGIDLYSANKLRKFGGEFNSLQRNIEQNTTFILNSISKVADLQAATMFGINELSKQLTELSDISWSIANYFERKESKDNFIGDLKMLIFKFNDELDSIDKLSEKYTEYAVLQVENLQALVIKHNVKIEHFKTLSFEDIDRAKGILERIDNTHSLLMNKLLERDE